MSIDARLRKIEKEAATKQNHWAVFPFRYCEDPIEQSRVNQALVDEYIAKGNPTPQYCIFIDEVPIHGLGSH